MRYSLALLPLLAVLVEAIPPPDQGDCIRGRPRNRTRTRTRQPHTTTAVALPVNGGVQETSVLTTATVIIKTTGTGAGVTTAVSATKPPAITSSPSTTKAGTTTAAVPTTIAPTTGTGGSTGAAAGVLPVGLAMDWNSGANIASFGSGKIGWYYSWNLNTLSNTNTQGLEFVPMIWGADAANKFTGTLPSGTKHVLGFNEPDIGGQYGGSNIAAVDAAALHKQWTGKLAAGTGIKIGSPAVARGAVGHHKWMDAWLAACAGGCKFDFMPFHFYGTNADQLIEYAKAFHATYQKPLWITEWACHHYETGRVCSVAEVQQYMSTVIGWFRSAEGQKIVERWSWFGAFRDYAQKNANGILNLDGTANAVGKHYASL